MGMGAKKPKPIFLGRYCMLQSWPDYSDPTVLISDLVIVKKSFVMRQFQFAKVCQAFHHVFQAHKEIKDNNHKLDIGGALIRKC